MRINISVWRLVAEIIISTLIVNTTVLNHKHVVAELSVIPLWNVTVNKTDAVPCCLGTDSYLCDVVKLIGDKVETCSVQLTSSNGTAALLWIPKGSLVYAERKENIFKCQMKYVSLSADENCFLVLRHPKVQLFLQGDSTNASSINISQMPVNISAPICPDGISSKRQHTPIVSQINHCQAHEYEDLISCNLSTDYTCSFKFPGNCNVTLGNRVIELQCLNDNAHSGHKALTVYPPGIITLDLQGQSIVKLNVNPFMHLKSLKTLLLSYNDLVVLPSGLLSGVKNLEYLNLRTNHITSLDETLFNETDKLTKLDLSANNLTVLPKELFTGLTNLEYLYLSTNQIKSLDEKLFNEPNKLIRLYLNENNLTVLPYGLFIRLENLEILSLSRNHISSLDDELFTTTNKLIKLYLYENSLKCLPYGLFMGLKNLEYLNLRTNQITSLDETLFNETDKLTKLDLSANNLTVLPKGLFTGLTNLEYLYLITNQIKSLDEKLFNETNKLIRLFLYGNSLKCLPYGLFMGLVNLEYLSFTKNQINAFDEQLFNETKKLTYLSFFHNNLVHLSINLFKGLSNLETLNLGDNEIVDVNKEMFRDLLNLRVLHLLNNRFKALSFDLFLYTRKISVLDLSGNKLITIPDTSILRHLFYLNIKGNKMTGITNGTFSDLPNQTELIAGQHEICECYVSKYINCKAVEERSPFLTCDRLLSDRVLVVLMWLIGLKAIGGNTFVLSRRQKMIDKNKVQTFLLRNLAMSDLIMGVYMLLIASADIYFGKYFPMHAETWRSGITCRIAGTMSILSSEASVFFVTLISIDRFVSIKYHNYRYKLRQRSSTVVAGVLWIVALALGIAPSSLAGKSYLFYDNSHVCVGLPLSKLRIYNTKESEIRVKDCFKGDICYWKNPIQSEYLGEVNGMIFASAMFLGLNFICYLVVLVCYAEIIRIFYKSSKRAGRNPEMKEQLRLTSRVAAIVLTNLACWFPIIIIGVLVQVGVLTLPPDVFAWCVTFVLPINSAINPYLYTIAGVISERRKQTRAKDLQHGSHQSNQRGRTPEVLNTSDLELGVITN